MKKLFEKGFLQDVRQNLQEILFKLESSLNMNQIDYENLGSRMKELRIKMKLTQAEVAKALNVTPGYISNVENNRTAMSLRILIYYARLLNISLDSLIGRIDSEYRETALDRELSEQVHKMSIPEKQKLLKTMKVWMEED